MRERTTLALLCAVATVGAPRGAHAQIGTGWTRLVLTQDFIDYEVADKHMRHDATSFAAGGMTYDHVGNVETFDLVNPMSNRVEHDTNHHYQKGKLQFQGDVQIFQGVGHQFIVQIFNAPASGPILALNAYSKNNGTIEKQGGSVVVASNAFGKTVRVNLVHDLDANKLTVYIDGKQAWTGAGGLGGSFNLKYGSYGSLNGSPSAKVQWTNVQLWTDGANDSSDAGAPADDAGAGEDGGAGEDAGESSDDAATVAPEDAAGGGVMTGGSGGSGGSGGAKGGTGGTAGAGGSSAGEGGAGGDDDGASTPPSRAAAKSGCTIASTPLTSAGWWPLAGALIAGRWMRRRRARRHR